MRFEDPACKTGVRAKPAADAVRLGDGVPGEEPDPDSEEGWEQGVGADDAREYAGRPIPLLAADEAAHDDREQSARARDACNGGRGGKTGRERVRTQDDGGFRENMRCRGRPGREGQENERAGSEERGDARVPREEPCAGEREMRD